VIAYMRNMTHVKTAILLVGLGLGPPHASWHTKPTRVPNRKRVCACGNNQQLYTQLLQSSSIDTTTTTTTNSHYQNNNKNKLTQQQTS